MNLSGIADWARVKGIDVVGTGDFTHPAHFATICEKLDMTEDGLFQLKTRARSDNPASFMLTAEVSNIFTQGGKTRKIHNLIFAPSLNAVKKINAELSRRANLSSDGRPIFGFSAKDLLSIVLDADPAAMLIPAHAWTPWFSIFGSKSGFDSIEECFEDLSPHIHAIETGLSSNPQMNRRINALDRITLISNSDAHSPQKLGREANVFDCEPSYDEITGIIKRKDFKKFLYTVEFYPEEGKYHSDGHRECGVLFTPEETAKAGGKCPVCGKAITIGVLSRVSALADRPEGFALKNAPGARHLVPLSEIIAETFNCGVNTLKVKNEYARLTATAGSEFAILLDMDKDGLVKTAGEKIATAVLKVRAGQLQITPGFDGEFGKIKIFGKVEKPTPASPARKQLF
jgi:uncharacterized protein (TIGR00375 family)